MNSTIRQFRDFFVSLQLTVVLLALSIVLVFAATLDQVNLGVWAVQAKYFRSFFVLWPVPGTQFSLPVFPGGYFVGGLLLINLLSAHVYRFKWSWRKSGIWLAHAGLILLLVGELLTGLVSEENQLRLDEGQTKNYSESFLKRELAVIDTSKPDYDTVVAIPMNLLSKGKLIQHPKLPFTLTPKAFFPNAQLQMRSQVPNPPPALATMGLGAQIVAEPAPVTYKPDEENTPTAVIELNGTTGPIGTVLVTTALADQPESFTYDNRTWQIVLRPKRFYTPYSVSLIKFTHDKYPGTEIPKNFASLVHVKTPDGRDDRDAKIYMNNPLRYGGFTFYQAGFENNDRTTILQVVKNPGWLLPYVACGLMTAGLLIQFGIHLVGFIRKRTAAAGAT